MQLLPTAILESSQADLNFQSLLQFYQDDLPSLVSFNAEFDLWKHKWLSEPQLASELDTPGKTWFILMVTFSQIYAYIAILLKTSNSS